MVRYSDGILIDKNLKGLTLTEVTFCMVIFSYFAVMIFSAVSAVQKMNAGDAYDKELLNEVRVVMEKILWGPGMKDSAEKDAISEAASYQIAGNTFHYTLPDGDERLIVRNQDELTFHKANKKTTLYDPNGEGNPPEPQNYKTVLNFKQASQKVLQVDLILGKLKDGKWHYASLSTSVALRN